MTRDRKRTTGGTGPAWWAMGLSAFSELTGWTVMPILAGLLIGRWFDERYDSAPWGFLGCTGIAFTASCIGIVMVGSKYVARIDREAQRDLDRDLEAADAPTQAKDNGHHE